MIDYEIRRLDTATAMDYIKKHHYSHGCHNGPSPCYGLYSPRPNDGIPTMDLFDKSSLIGVLMFATPCSENVRASVFGEDYKDWVIELHRLHILDVTPKNTESWFISRCLKLLKRDKPEIRAVLSFSDSTEGHNGTIYQATNALRCGKTGRAWFYLDKGGRLRHPHQCGVSITKEMAEQKGWVPVQRESKNRYLWLLPSDKRERKVLFKMLKIPYEIKYN